MYNYRKLDIVLAAWASDTDTILINLNSTYRLNFCAHSIDTGCTFCKTYSVCNWDNPAWVKITLNFLQCEIKLSSQETYAEVQGSQSHDQV